MKRILLFLATCAMVSAQICFVFDGDSRTYGYPSSETHADYPSQLVGLIPNSRIIANLGQPGATSLDIFNHVLPPATPGCHNEYLLWVGVGDLGRGWPVYSTLMNIYYALGRARGAGYEAFALTEPPILDPDFAQYDPQRIEFDSVMSKWPDALDIGSDPAWINNDEMFNTDPAVTGCCWLHPTGAGYGVVARDIAIMLITKELKTWRK